ncbi:MAG TPA: hypothetical protein VF733_04960 [Candidatus Saccharimonadales bacterium]
MRPYSQFRGELYTLQEDSPHLMDFQARAQDFIDDQNNIDTLPRRSDELFWSEGESLMKFVQDLDVDQTAMFVDTLARIDAVDTLDKNGMKHPSRVLDELRGVSKDHLRTLYGRGDREGLDAMYARNIDRADSRQFFDMLHTVEPVYGDALEIMSTPKEDLPAYLSMAIFDRGRQEELFLHNFPNDAGQKNYPDTARRAFQAGSLYLSNLAGLPQHIVTDIRRSFTDRFRPKKFEATDGSGLAYYSNEEVAYKLGKLKEAYRQVAHVAAQIGTDALVALYEKAGIVNFDEYPCEYLQNTLRLVKKDPTFIEELRRKKAVFYLSGAFGDHNNANAGKIETIDPSKIIVPFEVRQPSYAYRPFVQMKLFAEAHDAPEIIPSTVVFTDHGIPGSILVNGLSRWGFQLHASGYRRKDRPVFPLRETSIGRLVTEYMQPDDETGERTVVLHSCTQAVVYTSKNGRIQDSTAGAITRQVPAQARLVVAASNQQTTLAKGEGRETVFWDPSAKKRADAHSFYRRRFLPGFVLVKRTAEIPGLGK